MQPLPRSLETLTQLIRRDLPAAGKARRRVIASDYAPTQGPMLEKTDSLLVPRVKRSLYRAIIHHMEADASRWRPQHWLAKQLGLHQPDVSRLLKGELDRFSIELLLRTAERLGVEFTYDAKENAKAAKCYGKLLARCQKAEDTRDEKQIKVSVEAVTKSLIATKSPLALRLRRKIKQDAAMPLATMLGRDWESDLRWLIEELESLIADLN